MQRPAFYKLEFSALSYRVIWIVINLFLDCLNVVSLPFD